MHTKSGLTAKLPLLLLQGEQHARSIWHHLVTLFLFTKSDFKTVVFPQSAFAYAITLSINQAGATEHQYVQSTTGRALCMLSWIWLHLLVEDISNQRQPQSTLEDSENKPWRPIPAGRITPPQALSLLRVLVPLALLLGICLGSFTPSVTLMTTIWLYNDLDGSSAGVFQRNVLNAVGLACFSWGSVSVLLSGTFFTIGGQELLRNWIVLTTVVVGTTVQAQDLPDVVGDSARGRRTFPLVYGESCARWSIAVLAPAWSLVCTAFWRVPWLAAVAVLGVAFGMGTLALVRRDQGASEWVWKLWCLWVCILYMLPIFGCDLIW